ncbi:nitrogen fixation protein NifQ [Magnetospira thiophila]
MRMSESKIRRPVPGACRATAGRLLARARGDGNDLILARMLASWRFRRGILPRWMGLPSTEFRRLIQGHFPGFPMRCGTAITELVPPERDWERHDLRWLLMTHRAGRHRSEIWVAEIIAAACMGQNHLWEDLGLWSRADLTALMARNFPNLSLRNNKNMKWKKFLYKQLCEAEGIYVCRSPSCEVCVDYDVCFAADE